MVVVATASPGGPEALQVHEVEDLSASGEGKLLVGVSTVGVNRGDTVQRQGRYLPPAGASPYLGLECSSTIVALGANTPRAGLSVPGAKRAPMVYALLTGDGYAEKVVVPAGQLLPMTEGGGSLTDSRQLARDGLHRLVHRLHASHLSPGESFLIHGGSSGISTFTIQNAKHLGNVHMRHHSLCTLKKSYIYFLVELHFFGYKNRLSSNFLDSDSDGISDIKDTYFVNQVLKESSFM
ncbi:quinone oxidoreductase PIG3-like [Triticum aestivum]|uniref:quinone oxidoreductase PIG3-like n=1 Tax=Triticum aestivum TaxID=4565 RepID=UPI001D00DE34|nr:quinone oxidoreductase PIG3-like [Triticum aestivum]